MDPIDLCLGRSSSSTWRKASSPRSSHSCGVLGYICFMLTFCAAEKALATLQSRPILDVQPPALLVLSPYPSTTPPTPLPPPSASPRLVKHLPSGYADSQLYDLFRPYGALASVRMQAGFGKDTGVVEFWREEDAREAEEAMHCADVEGQNIAVQLYQPRRAGATLSEFNPTAPTFIPTGSVFPYPTQVSRSLMVPYFSVIHCHGSIPLHALRLTILVPLYLFTVPDSRFSWLL